ncbi:ATP-binding cassette domain-containing protein [Flavobacteriales bacterium]|nr:ATP-binding cassette domain-containing protein [Flavobacteriales bacterium]
MKLGAPVLKVTGISKTFKRTAKLNLTGENEKKEKAILEAISFELLPGDVLGLIGNNGVGKSTLLKIISGLIVPDTGEIRYSGRLASILEIGSGFHHDLTGRENIYVAGQLLGLHKRDVDAHLAEIVQFSGQEDHLDIPVKYYSNGMFLRLAFSVATTFPSDILLLDEVMSVGDLKFQEESVKRIRKITKSGTTVILASHELGAVQMLCNKVLLLGDGKIVEFGNPVSIIEDYLQKETFDSLLNDANNKPLLDEDKSENPALTDNQNIREPSSADEHDSVDSKMGLEIMVHQTHAYALGKERNANITSDDSVCVSIDFSKKWTGPVILSAVFSDKFRNNIMSFCNYRPLSPTDFIDTSEPERYSLLLTLPKGLLNAGLFRVSLYFADVNQRNILAIPDSIFFRVELGSYQLNEFKNESKYPGPLLPFGDWSLA